MNPGTLRKAAAGWAAVFILSGAGISGADEPFRLEPIVVTATRMEQKMSEQASAVSIVTRETIEETIPLVAGDALQRLPGVDVQRSGSSGNRENIKIRGGLGTHTLVLIDGFPVNSPTLGQFDISSLPVDGFDRIEVVRGTQSALYGSNAMGGVVNFVPPKAERGREAGAGTSAGNFETYAWKGFAGRAGDRGGIRLNASGFGSDGILPNDRTSLASFLGSGELATGGFGRLHALVLSTYQRKEIPVDFGTPRDRNHLLHRRGLLAGARWELFASDPFAVTAAGSLFDESFRERDPADPGEVFPFVFDDDTKTRTMTVSVQGRLAAAGRSTTFLGFEYRKDRGTDTLLSNFGDTRLAASTFNRSVYIQEELRLRPGTGLSLGVRLDDNSKAGTELNPKVGIYQEFPGTGARVRAAAGRGFRVPTISEQSDPFIGNPGLSPETAVSWEAGIDAALPGGRGTVSATWFYQDFRDLIQFDGAVPGPAGFGELRNIGKAFSRGVEAQAEVFLVPEASLLLVYTYSDTWDFANRQRILGVPTQRGSVSLLLHPSPRWEGRIEWRAESDQLDPPPNGGDIRRPGYARVDLSARCRLPDPGGRFPEIDLFGKAENLLDRNYEERNGFPSPGFHFLLGAEARI